jgi:hypothetical protein
LEKYNLIVFVLLRRKSKIVKEVRIIAISPCNTCPCPSPAKAPEEGQREARQREKEN